MQISSIIFSFLTAFFLSIFGFLGVIPLLRKLKAGQNILSYVHEHSKKNGTPTMGGSVFVTASIISCLCFVDSLDRTLAVTLVIGLAYMLIGLLDDALKMKRKENLGLTAWQKIIFQISVAIFATVYAKGAGLTTLNIPFFNEQIDFGVWIIPVGIFVFLATVNCVNLTDGLDGLASSSCFPFFLFFGVLLCLHGNQNLSILAFCISASLMAYLCFNSNPASIFMGDTGSLSLGGLASCIALFSGNLLYIATVGVVFILSGASVILQVAYFKWTKGKRIFKMTPIHHHFQQCGYSEAKISYCYFALTCILALINFAFLIAK